MGKDEEKITVKEACNQVYVVYPRGDKLDISTDKKPVAFFLYGSHADRFCKNYWPTTGEVIPMTKTKEGLLRVIEEMQ